MVVAAGLGVTGYALSIAWAAPFGLSFLIAALALPHFIRAHDWPKGPLTAERIGAAFWGYAIPRGFAGVFIATVTWFSTCSASS